MKTFPLNDDGVHLASEGDGPQRDDEEQVGNVRLDALPMKYLTLTRTEKENVQQVFNSFDTMMITHSQVS